MNKIRIIIEYVPEPSDYDSDRPGGPTLEFMLNQDKDSFENGFMVIDELIANNPTASIGWEGVVSID